jgi:hypothetical protein
MISNLRFDGHGVFAGVYEAAAHYYALHLVCHLEATVVCGVVCFGGLLRAEVSWVSSIFRCRAKHASARDGISITPSMWTSKLLLSHAYKCRIGFARTACLIRKAVKMTRYL